MYTITTDQGVWQGDDLAVLVPLVEHTSGDIQVNDMTFADYQQFDLWARENC